MEAARSRNLKQLLRAFAPAALILAVMLAFTVLFRAILTPFILAVVVVYVMEPVVQRLNLRGTFGYHWPRWVAIVSVYLALLGVITAFGFVVVPSIASETSRLARELPSMVSETRARIVTATGRLEDFLDVSGRDRPLLGNPVVEEAPAPEPAAPPAFTVIPTADGAWEVRLGAVDIQTTDAGGGYRIALRSGHREARDHRSIDLSSAVDLKLGELVDTSDERVGQAVGLARKVAEGVVGSIMGLSLTFMIAAFISMDLNHILAYFRGLIPPRHRQTADLLLVQLDRRLAGVIRGQLIICVVNGTLTWIVLELLHMRFVALLTVVATVFTLIPIFGMIISSIPAVVIALIDGGVEKALLLIAGVLFIHFLEANFFNPKILGTAARINPVLVIFALLAGESTFGLMGALLAVPTMAIFLTLLQFVVDQLAAWDQAHRPIPEPAPHDPAVP